MSRYRYVGVARGSTWSTALPLALAGMFTLPGCGLDAGGCAQSCASGCGECAALDGCGCTTGPIPGGFDREREIDNALQVRLGPSGLQFIEDNVEALAASALMSESELRVPVDPAFVRLSDTEVVALCVGDELLAFSGGSGSTSEDITPLVSARTWFVTEGGTNATTLLVTRVTGPGAPVELLRLEGGDTLFASHVVFGDLPLEAGFTYRATLTKPVASLPTTLHAFGGGRCALDLTLGELALGTEVGDPDALTVEIGAGAQSLDGAGTRAPFPVESFATGIAVVPEGCTVDVDTAAPGGAADVITVALRAGIAEVEAGVRAGYSRLDVADLRLVDPGLEDGDFTFGGCAASGLLNPFRGLIVSAIEDQLPSVGEGLSNLCQPARANPASAGDTTLCPTGSEPNDDGICIDASTGECVPLLLGLETRLGAGAGTAAFLPSLRAGFDTLLALAGEGEAIGGGYSLAVVAGAEALQTSGCVELPPEEERPTRPNEIPRLDALRGQNDAHDISLAVSERFVNWAVYELWRAGFLCVEVNSSVAQQLSTGLFSLLIPSLRSLTFPESAASMAVALRPQRPPELTFGEGSGTSPLVRVFFPSLAVDIYVYSTERYVRVLTLDMDLGADVNLDISEGLVTPLLALDVANAVVTNSDLLREDPDTLSRVLANVLTSFAPMFTADIDPIDPSALAGDALPVGIALGQDSLRRVEQTREGAEPEAFLGVFVDLTRAGATALRDAERVRVAITSKELGDAEAFTLAHFGQGPLPRLEVAFEVESADTRPREYSHRLDGGPWSEFRPSPYAVVEDAGLFRQGRHTLSVRARPQGSESFGSVGRQDFVVDVGAPLVTLSREGDRFWVMDAVEPTHALEYRTRDHQGRAGEWRALEADEVALSAPVDVVEVRDPSGNVGVSSSALRGLPPPSAGTGCDGCATQGARAPNAGAWLALALFGLLAHRRRSRH